MKHEYLLCMVLFAAALQAPAAQPAATAITITQAPSAIVIDGQLNEPAYSASKSLQLVKVPGGGKTKYPTETWIFEGPDALYIAFKCHDDNTTALQKNITTRDGNIWSDDCVEIFLDTNLDRQGYYHFGLNPIAVQYDASCQPGGKTSDWNCQWQAKTFIADKFWSAEVKIPLPQFIISQRFGLNLCRERRGGECSSMAILTGLFHEPSEFVEIAGLKQANIQYIRSITDGEFLPGKGNEWLATLTNDSPAPKKFTLRVTAVDSSGRKQTHSTTADTAPGNSTEISLAWPSKTRIQGQYELDVLSDGNLMYRKSGEIPHAFTMALAGNIFYVGEEIPLLINNLNLNSQDKLVFEVVLLGPGTKVSMKTTPADEVFTAKKVCVVIPTVPDGNYRLEARLVDSDGIILDSVAVPIILMNLE